MLSAWEWCREHWGLVLLAVWLGGIWGTVVLHHIGQWLEKR